MPKHSTNVAQRKGRAPLGKNLKCSIVSLQACCLQRYARPRSRPSYHTAETCSHCSRQASATQVPRKGRCTPNPRCAAAQAPALFPTTFVACTAPQKPASLATRNLDAKPRELLLVIRFLISPKQQPATCLSFFTVTLNIWSFSLLFPPWVSKVHDYSILFVAKNTSVGHLRKPSTRSKVAASSRSRHSFAASQSNHRTVYRRRNPLNSAIVYSQTNLVSRALRDATSSAAQSSHHRWCSSPVRYFETVGAV